MIFRLSQRLKQKIKIGTLNASPLDRNPFGDWSCHIFPANRRQYILLCNTKSLYSCVMPAKGITNQKVFAEKAVDCIRDFTADDANQWAFRKFIAPEFKTVQFGKALNRSVTSSMNQLIEYAQDLLIVDAMSPHEVGFKLNDFLLSAIAAKKSDGYGTPNDAFRRMVDSKNQEEVESDLREDETLEKITRWFVYILRCADDSLDTGITTDLRRRCEQHNAGTASRYTRSRLPVTMVYHETQENRSMALKRELEIKAMPRRAKESLIKSLK
ncbi:GIY-YIG nuclease family protein [Gimesia chilikensis]|uniref:GIY-YIG nuclease superfamily protein n=1 Tax=Gimesia chilikensis TaxID=2605989 RepID=A0A517PKH2_9PLAN|nr:GIY-YIG nuclease family protein [Gimesia chilikensis]QDT19875.1 GIY-YIG nuclease superfamily protein [Gimesia chilikensis]